MDPLDLGEGSDGAPSPFEESLDVKGSAPGGMEQCVPIDSLAMPEEGDELANPEVGDQVSYTVEGKVTRIVGGQAYVAPESVNGQPVETPKEAAPTMSPDDQLAGEMEQKGYL